jgi:hypothetical protein
MSYRGLGSLTTGDSYPMGTQVAAGYSVTGLASSAAAGAVQRLREAMATSFPYGSVSSVGWGPAFQVPSGRLYAVVSTNADGVTGAQVNAALVAVGRDLQSRLGGGMVVRNTNAHTLGAAAPLPPLTPDQGEVRSSAGLIIGLAAGGLALVAAALVFVSRRRPAVKSNRRRSRRRAS